MDKQSENSIWRMKLSLRAIGSYYWLILILLGILSIFFMRYLIPDGIGLVNDSVGYIGGARNILAGKGYSRTVGDGSVTPITHFPPLFSVILAVVSSFGFETIQASQWVVLFFFGANAVLLGILIRQLSHNRIASLIGVIFFILSEPFLRVHSFALSEPTYIFFTLIVLMLLIKYQDQDHWTVLAGAGLGSSLALLTRYVGVTLYLVALVVIWYRGASWKIRLRHGLIYCATGLPLVIAWAVRGMIITGNATNRLFIYHPVEEDVIQEGLINFWGWLLPEYGGILEKFPLLWLGLMVILLMAMTVFVVLLLRGYRMRSNETEVGNKDSLSIIPILLHALIYPAVVLLSMTFFDDSTRFEYRILAPFTVSILVILAWGANWVWRRSKIAIRLGLVIGCFALFLFVAEDTWDTVKYLRRDGQGFASSRWRESELIQVVKILPEDKVIFSNRITATYLLADRPTFIIPWQYNPVSGLEEPSYRQNIEKDRQMVLEGKALIVIFDYDFQVESGDIPIIELTRDLPIYQRCSDGVIFGIRDESSTYKTGNEQ